MARPRSQLVLKAKAELTDRLEKGFFRPGSQFCSNREVTSRYGVSYQTAHRIIQELADEGYLHRIPQSGTYVAKSSPPPEGVVLVFHPTVAEEGSFGSILFHNLQERFQAEGVPCELITSKLFRGYKEKRYSIIWAQRYNLHRISSHLQYSLMVDDLPNDGLNCTFTDSIFLDYRWIGQTCAKLLKHKYHCENPAVIQVHTHKPVEFLMEGFCSVYPNAEIFMQKDYSDEAATEAIDSVYRGNHEAKTFDGFFTMGGDASEAVIKTLFGSNVPIVVHRDMDCMLNTGTEGVAIPWKQIVDEIIRLYRLRQDGYTGVGFPATIKPDSSMVLNSLRTSA